MAACVIAGIEVTEPAAFKEYRPFDDHATFNTGAFVPVDGGTLAA